MPRQLKGTLEDFHTTQLLHLINLAKKTGTLHLYEPVPTGREIIIGDGQTKRPEVAPGKERAKVSFREGKLIHASAGSQDGHLATVLHKSGKLNDDQHRIIREKAANASDKALALLLINANYVTQMDIIQSVRKHMEDIVYDIMVWNKEPFIFEEGEQPTNDRITVPVELENIIIQGTERIIELDRLTKELPNLDFALRFPEAPSEKFKGIQLNTEQWRVVSFINPKNSIRQIAKACNMNDTEIRRIVYGLMNAGLVELVKAQSAKPPDPKRPQKLSTPSDKKTILNIIDRIKKL
jgi:hypothetical protein